MMNLTNLEINFLRLLTKVEEIAENQDTTSNWRFEKYTTSLEDYLKNLNNLSACKPSVDTLRSYSKRVEFLKQLVDLNTKKVASHKEEKQPTEVVSTTIKLNNPGPIISKQDVRPKQIYHKAKLNQEDLIRKQLFSTSKKSLSSDESEANEEIQDMNKLLAKEQEVQEKVASQMLKSVKAIKENSLLANRIIKSDNKLLSELNSNAEKNTDNLKVVNEHLNARVSRSCNCWIWLVILLIMIVFIMMVLFMKLFPKKKYYDTTSSSSSVDETTYTHFINNKTILIDNQTIHTIEL